jgi:hypothetical protein
VQKQESFFSKLFKPGPLLSGKKLANAPSSNFLDDFAGPIIIVQ